ncbi:hypothetical protein [Candidatus Hikarchaeum yamanae]|uniref:hypothetical protein n=1 Tax=Candidatus Hikarchaeum yamanae TaxID=2675326 RepID=UPI0039EAA646|tara:strand:- start:36689 stop:37204 length:516 start_codon:yes stop_codon:yes gene_type:complete
MNSNEDQNNSENIPTSLGFLSPSDREYLLFGEGDLDAAELQKRKNSIRDNTIGGLIDFTYLVNLDLDTRTEIFKNLVPILDQETFPNFDDHSERILISPSIYLGVSHCIDFLYTSLGFSRFKKLLQISLFQALFWECRKHFERIHPVRPEDIHFNIDIDTSESSYLHDLFR